MSEVEVRNILEEIFAEVKPESIKEMGKIMKCATDKMPNADMALVSKIVKEKLS